MQDTSLDIWMDGAAGTGHIGIPAGMTRIGIMVFFGTIAHIGVMDLIGITGHIGITDIAAHIGMTHGITGLITHIIAITGDLAITHIRAILTIPEADGSLKEAIEVLFT